MTLKTIPLGGKKAVGRAAQVDDADHELVGQYSWHIYEREREGRREGPYAVTSIGRGPSRVLYMHKLLTGWPQTRHVDGNGLNNQRSNLQPIRPAEPGLCACGCGQRLKRDTGRRIPTWAKGHYGKGARSAKWKGDDASYGAIHAYLRKHFPKAGICEECGQAKRTDYALIKGREYSRNREDYRELCERCHIRYDDIGGSRWRGTATASAAGEPICACGCGEPAGWNAHTSRWRRFAQGHHTKEAQRGNS